MSDFSFDDVEEQTFAELPDGTYLGMIEKAEVGDSNGHPTVRCQFRIITGPYKNRVISDFLHFTMKAAGLIKGKLKAAGVEIPTGLADADAYAAECARLLVPQRAEIVVESETYNGKTSARVKAWKPAPPQPEMPVAAGGIPVDDGSDIPFAWRDNFDATTL